MIQFSGIHHLAMVTRDMDATIRFWRDLLGMRLVAGLGKPGYRHYFFEISATDMLAFFEWPEVEPLAEKDHGYPVKGPFVFDHISFGVEAEESLWLLKERLDAAGFWVSEMIDHGFIHSIYAFDPNGIPIEFSCPARGMDLRKTPRLVDRAPSAITLEGPDPQPGHWPTPPATDPADRAVYPGEGLDLLQEVKNNWRDRRP